jgi:predicted RNA-binding Zn-ribbon protein involved in translation (DUF1610 family)
MGWWSCSSGTAEDVNDRLPMAACKTKRNDNMHECQNCHRDFKKKTMGFSCPYCGYINDLRRGRTYMASTDETIPLWKENDRWEEYLGRVLTVRRNGGPPRVATDAAYRRMEQRHQAAMRKINTAGERAA